MYNTIIVQWYITKYYHVELATVHRSNHISTCWLSDLKSSWHLHFLLWQDSLFTFSVILMAVSWSLYKMRIMLEFGHQKKDVIGFVTDIKKNYECTYKELNPRHLDVCSDVLLLSYRELKGNLHYIPSLMWLSILPYTILMRVVIRICDHNLASEWVLTNIMWCQNIITFLICGFVRIT